MIYHQAMPGAAFLEADFSYMSCSACSKKTRLYCTRLCCLVMITTNYRDPSNVLAAVAPYCCLQGTFGPLVPAQAAAAAAVGHQASPLALSWQCCCRCLLLPQLCFLYGGAGTSAAGNSSTWQQPCGRKIAISCRHQSQQGILLMLSLLGGMISSSSVNSRGLESSLTVHVMWCMVTAATAEAAEPPEQQERLTLLGTAAVVRE